MSLGRPLFKPGGRNGLDLSDIRASSHPAGALLRLHTRPRLEQGSAAAKEYKSYNAGKNLQSHARRRLLNLHSVYLIAFKLVIERLQAHPERFSGQPLVAPQLVQRGENQITFDLL